MWDFNFPFTLSDVEVESLGKGLPFFGKNIRIRGGKIIFNDYISDGYESLQYFNVLASDNEFDLDYVPCSEKQLNLFGDELSTGSNLIPINKRMMQQLDHFYYKKKYISDLHLEFIYKW